MKTIYDFGAITLPVIFYQNKSKANRSLLKVFGGDVNAPSFDNGAIILNGPSTLASVARELNGTGQPHGHL